MTKDSNDSKSLRARIKIRFGNQTSFACLWSQLAPFHVASHCHLAFVDH